MDDVDIFTYGIGDGVVPLEDDDAVIYLGVKLLMTAEDYIDGPALEQKVSATAQLARPTVGPQGPLEPVPYAPIERIAAIDHATGEVIVVWRRAFRKQEKTRSRR